jgi:hypothetical protein
VAAWYPAAHHPVACTVLASLAARRRHYQCQDLNDGPALDRPPAARSMALGSQLLKRAEETANLSRMCGRLASAGKYIDNPVGAPYLPKDEGELFTDALPATGGHGAQRCGTFQFHQDLIWA